MPVNAGYEYFAAEKKYLAAQTIDEKIKYLEEMLRASPKHKSSENFVAEIKNRLRKMIEKKEKSKKVGKSSKKGIRKEGFQFVLVGKTGAGKSSLLEKLTNARPLITPYPFTTKYPEIGTFNHEGVKAQIIDLPAVHSEFFDIGLANTADGILIVIEKIEDLEEIKPIIFRSVGKQLIIINKADLLFQEELRKLQERLKSKKINALIVSANSGYNLDSLKNSMLKSMSVIRIFTKEPGKPASKDPIVLKESSTVTNVAESIRKGFSAQIKETRLTGPSGKFTNQKVGLNHILKDLDIIEFHTKK